MLLTIQLHTISIRLRSGEFGGHDGRRSSSRVCLVIWVLILVLLTAVVSALLSYQLPDLILLILSRGVADDVDTVLRVALADCDVIVW